MPKTPTLLLSAGHLPGETGARYEEYNEHDIVRGICWYAAGEIGNSQVRIPTVIVPTGSLTNKIAWVNEWADEHRLSPCFAVELHCDSYTDASVKGMSVFHYAGNRMTSKMAHALLEGVCRPSWPNRGVKTPKEANRKSLGWIGKTTMPSLLVEVGFITNRAQREFMTKDAGQHSLGIRLAEGLVDAAIFMDSFQNDDGPGGVKMTKGKYDKNQWRDGDAIGTLDEGKTEGDRFEGRWK